VNRVILKQPVAVFDAGIGSYAIARKIADRFSGQDVLYFAERANFPYGASDLVELVENGCLPNRR
jgi:glutamate racemase